MVAEQLPASLGPNSQAQQHVRMATMDAIVLDPVTNNLALKKLDMPAPVEKNEVLVKVAFSGVCGTDLKIIDVSIIPS